MNSSTSKNQIICKMCKSADCELFSNYLVLNKYRSNLYKCKSCKFHWLSNSEIWLAEAYDQSICISDTGIVIRSLFMSKFAIVFLYLINTNNKVLDWGAGSGLFVRFLRDKGVSCEGFEPYGNSPLAQAFCYKKNPLSDKKNYKIIFATEVLEHIVNPSELLDQILKKSDSIIFTTQLVPSNEKIKDWWYIANELGQHICFQSEKSLREYAKSKNLYCVLSRKLGIHLVTKSKYHQIIFKLILGKKRILLLYLPILLLKKFSKNQCNAQKDNEDCMNLIKKSFLQN